MKDLRRVVRWLFPTRGFTAFVGIVSALIIGAAFADVSMAAIWIFLGIVFAVYAVVVLRAEMRRSDPGSR